MVWKSCFITFSRLVLSVLFPFNGSWSTKKLNGSGVFWGALAGLRTWWSCAKLAFSLGHWKTLEDSFGNASFLVSFFSGATDSLVGVPLYIMNYFSPAAFKIISLSLTFRILNIMCLRVFLWVDLIWGPLSFLYLEIHISSKIWEVFSYHFFKYIFCLFLSLLFSETPMIWMFIWLMVSYNSCRFSLLFFILLSFCSSNWLISNNLSSGSLSLTSASSFYKWTS